jgi:hypothetical protein
MLNLPPTIMTVLMPFAPLFHVKTWRKVPILLIGALLTPGKRTVTAALRVMGLQADGQFAKYHQVVLATPHIRSDLREDVRSSSLTRIGMMEPAQHRARDDFALTHWRRCRRGWNTLVDALMWAVFIEVIHILLHDAA